MTYTPISETTIPVYNIHYSCGCDAKISSPGVADPMGLLAEIQGDRLDVHDAFPCSLHKRNSRQ